MFSSKYIDIVNISKTSISMLTLMYRPTPVATKGQLSVILRYVDIGAAIIEERFVGFYDMPADKTASGISQVLLDLLQK